MFKIGSLVSLKSNPDLKMTISDIDSYTEKAICTFISKAQKIENHAFNIDCLNIFEEKLLELELKKIPLLFCKEKDCYAFFEYASMFGQNINPNATSDEKTIKNAKFVYDFKKYFPKNKQKVFNLINMAKAFLDCEQIVCIPSHLTELNSLQKLFGLTIERLIEVAPRKYNHKSKIDDSHRATYQINYSNLKNKLLLVDDILTSGATLRHFKDILTNKGFKVESVVLGINHKLSVQVINHFWLFN